MRDVTGREIRYGDWLAIASNGAIVFGVARDVRACFTRVSTEDATVDTLVGVDDHSALVVDRARVPVHVVAQIEGRA